MKLQEGILYKFETENCMVCKMMEPIFQEFLNKNSDVVFEKKDARKEIDLSEKIGITNVPVFLYVDNEEFHMISGMVEKKEFVKFTKKFLKTL